MFKISNDFSVIENLSLAIRRQIIETSFAAKVGHIASELSIVDILSVLYGTGTIPTNDLVLSKGHAALTQYVAMDLLGLLPKNSPLANYCGDNTLLGVHPSHFLEGMLFSTGSLGQGLSYATGLMLARRIRKQSVVVIVILSDAELNEGSTWESIMFAGHHQIPMLAVVDVNGQQALGYTKDVLDLQPLAPKFAAFNWDVDECDGHNVSELLPLLTTLPRTRPHVILANTIAGKGVSFMEGKVAWHYLPLNEDQYIRAKEELRN